MKTIIFVWDRKNDLIPKEDTIGKALEASAPATLLWRKWLADPRHVTQAEEGDRFFIMKRDRARQGIFMSGFLDKAPRKSQHEWQFTLSPDALIDWTREPVLDSRAFPGFRFGWSADLEEAVLPREDARILELLWARHLFNAKGHVCEPNTILNEAIKIAKGESCELCGKALYSKYDVFYKPEVMKPQWNEVKPGDDIIANYFLLCDSCAGIQASLGK